MGKIPRRRAWQPPPAFFFLKKIDLFFKLKDNCFTEFCWFLPNMVHCGRAWTEFGAQEKVFV
ncbi:hypothetical protein DP135_25550 [Salmonella enterica subsp. enterica serovar Typhimurium]|nr:hypothetical protein DP135_25550 [Salmonella enterica subsp. enterica serovar Typhimurium]